MKIRKNKLMRLLLFRRGEILPYRHKILLLTEQTDAESEQVGKRFPQVHIKMTRDLPLQIKSGRGYMNTKRPAEN